MKKAINIYTEKAKKIRNLLTTREAGCYRLDKIPRSATVKAIETIIKAHETLDYAAVFKTDLYKNDSPEYCSILAIICSK